MFVVIVNFPPIKAGKETEFQQWFASSNQVFSGFEGFVRRRLLKSVEGETYAAIVEFETRAAFQAMHNSPVHDMYGEQVMPLFDGRPVPAFYEVIAG
ncbi:Antibiotic biosynthesis monooxygenase [Geobacter metallireducens RCH3]|uniref:Antibiotic biosynthesis monooxygenase domain protein n=1 Tax=Geobacter metallireducens (strain ATCC 53774 / DSM 7210 / GS-15) TaxID=269799 RepID=Q39WX1_GEOMG|nr:antibiotic biosynthesis monooxygenase [Geobacter metallireducens]ABB31253.1 antibiotic biosynthesis monooxygenase domain protein [Geobacter metallireducens GS-15]EHP86495.1 Antibiotic biosynthesis monooxygenase [Geobacter metallireducens RCH3]